MSSPPIADPSPAAYSPAMRRISAGLATLLFAACGDGPGGDKETFCAAVAEHAEGADGAMERMIEIAPDAVREDLELLQRTDADGTATSTPEANESARESVNMFIRNKCQLDVEI